MSKKKLIKTIQIVKKINMADNRLPKIAPLHMDLDMIADSSKSLKDNMLTAAYTLLKTRKKPIQKIEYVTPFQ